MRATLRECEERLELSQERLLHSEELRSKEADKAQQLLDAARKSLEEAEADASEQSQERSARAAGLQDLLRDQGALLAERWASGESNGGHSMVLGLDFIEVVVLR